LLRRYLKRTTIYDPAIGLQSFTPGGTAVVVGATGGIGAALVALLVQDRSIGRVLALSRGAERTGERTDGLRHLRVDITDEASIQAAAAQVEKPLQLIIVATGALHGQRLGQPEKTFRALDADALLESYRINAVGPALLAKHFLPLLAAPGRSVFAVMSARVGSIGDNRTGGWHGYRASKAALNMILRNLAIEVSRRAPETLCVGLHPGTVDTGLSQPFQRHVAAGALFTPHQSATYLLGVIDGLRPENTGHVLAWDGNIIVP
jgi:NAD(P)-dependent dehydrogenase (short-subunit alcohol dehydrogenase family)